MKYLFLGVALLFTTLQFLNAQNSKVEPSESYKAMMHDHSYNFYEVVDAAEAYFSTIDRTEKGSGWKPFQRWIAANEYKYFPDGNRTNVNPELVSDSYSSFIAKNPVNKSVNDSWKDLGPYTIDNITGHYSAGLGRIDAFHVDGDNSNLVYLGSRSGGFWKTTNGGLTWTGGSTDFLPATGVDKIAVSPINPDSILINLRNSRSGHSHGIYRSINGGDTWNLSNFSPANVGQGGLGDNFVIKDIKIHPANPNLIFVGTNEGIYRSTDNLATWSRTHSDKDIKEITFHRTNPDIIYMYDDYYWNPENHNQIFKSIDAGVTWAKTNIIPNNNGNKGIELITVDLCPNCLYVASENGVWISTDSGENFTMRSNPESSSPGFAVSDTDTSKMSYGYVDLYMSADGGKTFNQSTYWSLGNTNGSGSTNQASYQNSTNYIHADTDEANCVKGVFYASTDGFLCKSEDNGVTWKKMSEGVGIRENYKLGTSQSNHYRTACGSQDNGASINTENGWIEFYGADGMENIIHPLNDDWIITSLQNGGRRRTKDGGKTQEGATPSGSNSGQWEAPLLYDPTDQMTIYDFRDTVYRSDNFGTNHVKLGGPTTFTGTIQDAAIAENNTDIIIISSGGAIEKSTNGGVTFSDIKGTLPNHDIQDIAFDPLDDNTMIVVYGRWQDDGQKVYKTTDGGTTWTNITHNLSNMPIRSVVVDHDNAKNIYLGAELGVYTMPMAGNNWVAYNTNFPNVSVEELEISYGSNTLKAATWGRGLWENNLVGRANYPKIMRTRISDLPTEEAPKEGVEQFVISNIDYSGNLSSVEVHWSIGTPALDNVIMMTNEFGNVWKSNTGIPGQLNGVKVYFQIKAIASLSEITTSYTYMYETREFSVCAAAGSNGAGSLHMDNVTLENLNNNSVYSDYIEYASPVVSLSTNQVYTISTSANTGWTDNDFQAWIDYNNDGSFTEEEKIFEDYNTGSEGTGTFTPRPDAVLNTNLRMRVRLSYWGSGAPACGTHFGEVEDYFVNISDGGCGIVSNLADSGTGSLRQIIDCTIAGSEVLFSELLDGQTITINSNKLIVNKSLVFKGDAGRQIKISSIKPQVSTLSTLMDIQAGQMVTIIGLTVEGAFGLEGSAILNAGNLKLDDVIITNGGKSDVISTVKNIGAGTISVDTDSKID